MRITNQMAVDNVISQVNDNLEKMKRLQDKIITGKQYAIASENPTAASASLTLRSSLKSLQAYLDTNGQVKDWMTASEFAFQQMEDLSNRAIVLITRGLNDTLGEQERKNVLAPELWGILSQSVEIGNSSLNGKYLFSGHKTTTKTFELNSDGSVTYFGDTDGGFMQRKLSPGQSITINTRGDLVFPNFYEALNQARQALTENNTDSLREALGKLQSAADHFNQHRTSLGTRLRQVQQATDYLTKTKIEAHSLLSQKEDINLAEGIALLRNQETTYQAVLEVSQRAISALSLFDYLK